MGRLVATPADWVWSTWVSSRLWTVPGWRGYQPRFVTPESECSFVRQIIGDLAHHIALGSRFYS